MDALKGVLSAWSIVVYLSALDSECLMYVCWVDIYLLDKRAILWYKSNILMGLKSRDAG